MLTYKTAGVDLENSNKLTSLILNNAIENDGFAGVFEHPLFKDYCLVSSTDGIGTKIEPLFKRKMYKQAAVDLIAMNLNDIAALGAKPLFFLDYIAVNKLDPDIISKFIICLKDELQKYDCSLLGGETSELNNLLYENSIDISGFVVGIIKKENILKKENIKENDVLIALKSSGAHSNGFSLLRELDKKGLINIDDYLEPTRIYIKEVSTLAEEKKIISAANITGGGIIDNLKRIIPKDLFVSIDENKIKKDENFIRLENILGKPECYRTFNMGIGFILVCNKDDVDYVLDKTKKFDSYILGKIVKNNGYKETVDICFGQGDKL